MRLSPPCVGAAIGIIMSTSGCAADTTPGPSTPSVVNVAPVPPPDNPPVSVEQEPDTERSSEVHDDACRELAETMQSNSMRITVFLRAQGPICLGPVAAADDVALEDAAREAAERGATAAVLYVDSSVVYARVIAVMDVLRRTGIEHVSLAVGPQP